MRYLFVGDLHGRLEIVDAVATYAATHRLVFLGDYLDSFTRSVDQQIATLRGVLDLVEAGKADALLGNHEQSYLNKSQRCSGWNFSTQIEISRMGSRMSRLLRPSLVILPNIVVTHAGLTRDFWAQERLTIDTIASTLEEFGRSPFSPAFACAASRGGTDRNPGHYWCDWYQDFQPVPDIVQVVGHTPHGPLDDSPLMIRTHGTNYNVDCLDRTAAVLEYITETDTWTPHPL